SDSADRKRLAETMGISRNALSIRIKRIKNALRAIGDALLSGLMSRGDNAEFAAPPDLPSLLHAIQGKLAPREAARLLGAKRCSVCNQLLEGERATRRQTKYCSDCARAVKRRQTQESCPPQDRKEYQRQYLRAYRKRHPGYNNKYVKRHREKARIEAELTR